jgi:hypothetical protein
MKRVYIYETPKLKARGLLKIGDAPADDIRMTGRVNAQLNTAAAADAEDLKFDILWYTDAVRADGTEFRDYDIHRILESKGYQRHQIEQDGVVLKSRTEQFSIELDKAIHLIESYKSGLSPEEIDIDRHQTFGMRPEQKAAVERTKRHFENQDSEQVIEFLWNAKMRFGKTFASYQLAKSMSLSKVLVVTYKPAVEDAWRTDLESHVDFKDYLFLSREAINYLGAHLRDGKRVVTFVSFQDMLGKGGDGSEIKLKHLNLFDTDWDLVIIDEFHYGAGTKKAKEMMISEASTTKEKKEVEQEVFSDEDEEHADEEKSEKIASEVEKTLKSRYRLYLSGTPFKAIADAKFGSDAIFNWTYADEQRAKEEWGVEFPNARDKNPYRDLPQINLYLYKVSKDLIDAGTKEGKDEFSLNHFFKVDKKTKKFINEAAVRRWLDLISGVLRPDESVETQIDNESCHAASQYPYDHNGKLIKELNHTLWYLNSVNSAVALSELLEQHPVFGGYRIVLAVGEHMKAGYEGVMQLRPVLERHEKTITLTVGKLTTGVSVPQWTAVMFLRDTDSPENYFQTAFRAQTPCRYEDGSIKERCYIFDFSPNRSLKLLTSYSEKLSPDSHLTTSEARISEFIRYLPVLKVQGNRMVELDAREVLAFDLTGIDAKGLGDRFMERRNVIVTREVIDAIKANHLTEIRCQEILDRIKMFRKFKAGDSDKDLEKFDVSVADLDVNEGKLKKLETKKELAKTEKQKNKVDEEIKEEEDRARSEREKMRGLLRTMFSRIPLFMYLTDATEENLEQVLGSDVDDLFRKATGITVDDFRFLRDVGLIKVESVDGYILRFLQLENKGYEINNNLLLGLGERVAD